LAAQVQNPRADLRGRYDQELPRADQLFQQFRGSQQPAAAPQPAAVTPAASDDMSVDDYLDQEIAQQQQQKPAQPVPTVNQQDTIPPQSQTGQPAPELTGTAGQILSGDPKTLKAYQRFVKENAPVDKSGKAIKVEDAMKDDALARIFQNDIEMEKTAKASGKPITDADRVARRAQMGMQWLYDDSNQGRPLPPMLHRAMLLNNWNPTQLERFKTEVPALYQQIQERRGEVQPTADTSSFAGDAPLQPGQAPPVDPAMQTPEAPLTDQAFQTILKENGIPYSRQHDRQLRQLAQGYQDGDPEITDAFFKFSDQIKAAKRNEARAMRAAKDAEMTRRAKIRTHPEEGPAAMNQIQEDPDVQQGTLEAENYRRAKQQTDRLFSGIPDFFKGPSNYAPPTPDAALSQAGVNMPQGGDLRDAYQKSIRPDPNGPLFQRGTGPQLPVAQIPADQQGNYTQPTPEELQSGAISRANQMTPAQLGMVAPTGPEPTTSNEDRIRMFQQEVVNKHPYLGGIAQGGLKTAAGLTDQITKVADWANARDQQGGMSEAVSNVTDFLRKQAGDWQKAADERPEGVGSLGQFLHSAIRTGTEAGGTIAKLSTMASASGFSLATTMGADAFISNIDQRPAKLVKEVGINYAFGKFFDAVNSTPITALGKAAKPAKIAIQSTAGYTMARLDGKPPDEAAATAIVFGGLELLHPGPTASETAEARSKIESAPVTQTPEALGIRDRIAQKFGYAKKIIFADGRYAEGYYNPDKGNFIGRVLSPDEVQTHIDAETKAPEVPEVSKEQTGLSPEMGPSVGSKFVQVPTQVFDSLFPETKAGAGNTEAPTSENATETTPATAIESPTAQVGQANPEGQGPEAPVSPYGATGRPLDEEEESGSDAGSVEPTEAAKPATATVSRETPETQGEAQLKPEETPVVAKDEGPGTKHPETGRKFSSTQVDLPSELATKQSVEASKIPDGELAADGREETPHITLKYGLHTDNPQDVAEILKGEGPIKAKIGKVSVFPAKEGADYDVVKMDVDSPDLHRLNKKISDGLKVTDTHPEYKPHVTLAYVKAGEGAKYAGKQNSLTGQEVTLDKVLFSGRDGTEESIPLQQPKGESPNDIKEQGANGSIAIKDSAEGTDMGKSVPDAAKEPVKIGDDFEFLGEKLRTEPMPGGKGGSVVRVTSLDENSSRIPSTKPVSKQRTFTPEEFEQTFGRPLEQSDVAVQGESVPDATPTAPPDRTVTKRGQSYVAPDGTAFTGPNSKRRAEEFARQKSYVGAKVKSYGGGIDTVLDVNVPENGGPPIYTVRGEDGEVRKHQTQITDDKVVEWPKGSDEAATDAAPTSDILTEAQQSELSSEYGTLTDRAIDGRNGRPKRSAKPEHLTRIREIERVVQRHKDAIAEQKAGDIQWKKQGDEWEGSLNGQNIGRVNARDGQFVAYSSKIQNSHQPTLEGAQLAVAYGHFRMSPAGMDERLRARDLGRMIINPGESRDRLPGKPAEPAKEPWQMTQAQVSLERAKSDFPITGKVEAKNEKPVYTYSTTVSWGDGEKTFEAESRGPLSGSVSAERLHRKVIEQALAEGKPVPPEVLKDYPDLAKAGDEGKSESIDDIVNSVFDEMFAEKPKPAAKPFFTEHDVTPVSMKQPDFESEVAAQSREKSAREAGKTAVTEAGKGLADVAKGLSEIFKGGSGGGNFNTGPGFDDETYERAKPFFIEGVKHFEKSGGSIRDMVKALLTALRDQFGLAVDQIREMLPYITQFMKDVEAGIIKLGEREVRDEAEPNIDQKAKEAENSLESEAENGNADLTDQNGQGSDEGTSAGDVRRPGARGKSGPRGNTKSDGGDGNLQSDEGPDAGHDGDIEETVPGAGTATDEPQPSRGGNRDSAGDRVPERRGNDYIAPVGGLTREGSWRETARRNLDILELVKKLETENRLATPEEQALLSKFTGWGASEIANNFFPGYGAEINPRYAKEGWKELAERAKALFTP
jgi:2'-5' RNA ligase